MPFLRLCLAGRSLTGVSLAQGVVDIQETRECAAWSADVMATVDA